MACDLQGDDIQTIEGVADGDILHPVQQAFLDYGAVQCGFCIPGMVMSAKALLERTSHPTQEEIEYALDGNICRCAGYPKIFDAVRKAGEVMSQGGQNKTEEMALKQAGPEKIVMGITYEEFIKTLKTTHEKDKAS
jgi:xanthine dehydrogenase iron-sulfur cluster and FAD-binding subunit A